MNTKRLNIIDNENKLEVFINTQNKIILAINIEEFDMTGSLISLDKEDATVLISELKKLIKEI